MTKSPQPSDSVVGGLYKVYKDFQATLEQMDDPEVSLRNSMENIFQKSLAIAIGNYFEHRVTDIVLEFVKKSSDNNVLIAEFVRSHMSRQYHNYFAWKNAAENANSFYVVFGEDFRKYMKKYINDNPQYGDSVKAFIRVGNIRNEVAHIENPTINQTTQELYALYEKAFVFVEELPLRFDEFMQSKMPEQA